MSRRRKTEGLAYELDQLYEKHRALDAEIELAMTRPMPDSLIIQRLKRRKLRVKDTIAKLSGVFLTLRRPVSLEPA